MRKQKTIKVINIMLWVAQTILAFIFIWAGTMKLFQPGELPWQWTRESPALLTISGIFDLLAGIGLTLPSMLRVKPELTIYAAYGTVLLMLAATIFHVMRGEGNQIGFNLFVLVTAVFIAWGRKKLAPIESKK